MTFKELRFKMNFTKLTSNSCHITLFRLKEFGVQVSFQEEPDLVRSKGNLHPIRQTMHSHGDISGG